MFNAISFTPIIPAQRRLRWVRQGTKELLRITDAAKDEQGWLCG
jgi:hypothetical protein